MKRMPLGIQNIREIIEGDYVYADKTQYVYELLKDVKYYFLSRPRRFGKSLLVDTIAETFGGDKELFKGLWIYGSDYGFPFHPVIRIDMSGVSSKNPDILNSSIEENLTLRGSNDDISINAVAPSGMLAALIMGLYKKYGKRVVVLIDEYDKPILDHLENPELADANRKTLRDFFGILKSMDPYLRMTFITGVSKFAKTSIFSELNNLLDITLFEKYSNICGVTIDDLDKYFSEHISYISGLGHFSEINVKENILKWYDGYSWGGATKAINPFSLLSFFVREDFSPFWYASGAPLFLLNLLKKQPMAYLNLNKTQITELILDYSDLDKIEIAPLLFQSGYLTIDDVFRVNGEKVYKLAMPNFEVKKSFNAHIITAFTENGSAQTQMAQMDISNALQNNDLAKMLLSLRGLFASIPYELHIDKEAYYHSIFYAIMNVLSYEMDVEVSVSHGRVDAVLETTSKIYVMELKYRDCSRVVEEAKKNEIAEAALDEAMAQINFKGYHTKYVNSKKEVYKVAFAFLGRDEITMLVELI